MRKENTTALRRAIALALATLIAWGSTRFVRAEGLAVSLVADRQLGTPASHGLEKIVVALRERGIACEKAATLEAARGKFVIAVGLAGGNGPAARLLASANHPLPKGPESLSIRRIDAGVSRSGSLPVPTTAG